MGQGRSWWLAAVFLVAAGAGLGAGYLLWGWPPNWYARDLAKLPSGAEGELIRYGHALVIDTAAHIGKSAADPGKRFAGNDLACTNCHLNAGLQPFGAPFVSTFGTFPMLVDDQVLSLKQRINGCMIRSMNGKVLPMESREMDAFVAYMKYLGTGTPESIRVAGMGLLKLDEPPSPPDRVRGDKAYAANCAGCHMPDGQGQRREPPAGGYTNPPLWGDDSFNDAAGMAKPAYAAAFIRANMPFGITYREPVLSVQESWDVAVFMISKPRPKAPPEAASALR
jgi:thiosulfate dehydrogenase